MTRKTATVVFASAALLLIAVAGTGLRTGLPALGAAHGSGPSFEEIRAASCPSDRRLLDRNGAVLHEVRIDASRRRLRWTPLDDVSPALVGALVRSEDRRFYDHGGVDWRAMVAAAWQRIQGGPPRGASTITMQLAALLDPDLRRGSWPRTPATKWRQMRGAWNLEASWTKPEILEAYLNLVTFRGELQGVGAASELIFDKAPHGLTTAQGALLAASLRSPNADAASLRRRGRSLLDALHAVVPEAELDNELERLQHAGGSSALRASLAPHAARRLLGRDPVESCGDLSSTLDADLQRLAAASLRRQLLAIRDHSVRDGAVLVVDNASGEVLAYVASSGDLSPAPEVDGVLAHRQAGSTLKPFLYALAFQKRLLTPATLLEDSPLEISLPGGSFEPRNYDGTFRGLVSARTALGGSLNVPAVRTLELVGEEDFAALLRGVGLDSVNRNGRFYGPSLALGSADVTLWELVTAYRTLANGGLWSGLRWSSGDAEGSGRQAARRVLDPGPAHLVADILSDRDSRAATFDLDSPLATAFWSAVKTGTSKDMRDNWCIGFSRRYTVGVWVGNFSGAPMRDVSGVTGAAPVWHEVLSWLHRDQTEPRPATPAGVNETWTTFAGDIEAARSESYLDGTEPEGGSAPLATRGRIVAPVSGTVVAIDPDIPPHRQRVAFVAEGSGVASPAAATLRWRLDGADLAAAGATVLWSPKAGHHTLDLLADDSRPLSTVRFEVRAP